MKHINDVNTKEELKDYFSSVVEENGIKFHTSKINNERMDELLEDLADTIMLDRATRASVDSNDMKNVVDVLEGTYGATKKTEDLIRTSNKGVTDVYKQTLHNRSLIEELKETVGKHPGLFYLLGLLSLINILITLFK